MKMTNLRPLFEDMQINNQKVIYFPFTYNGKAYSCLFEIISRPFKLQIATVGKDPVLFEFDVLPGFIIKSYLNSLDYSQLVRILGIKFDLSHTFKPDDFLRVLNAHIPESCKEAKINQNAAVRNRERILNDNDKEIFIGWYTNPPGKHVSIENYNKNREHFGAVYADYLRQINTSTRWTLTIEYTKKSY